MKNFLPKPQKNSANAARLLGCFSMSVECHSTPNLKKYAARLYPPLSIVAYHDKTSYFTAARVLKISTYQIFNSVEIRQGRG